MKDWDKELEKEIEAYKNWKDKFGGFSRDMTLRDYFAAKAMQGLIERETTGAFNFETCKDDPWRVAMWAYDVADQMLRVRSEK